MNTDDQAPRSSRRAAFAVGRANGLDQETFDRMIITTRIDHNERAVTRVSRPVVRDANEQTALDRAIEAQLRKLPGAEPGIPLAGVSQTWEVTWDGVRRPV